MLLKDKIINFYGTILDCQKKFNSQKEWKTTTYTVPCLSCNGKNSLKIEKANQIGSKCRRCSLIGRIKTRTLKYHTSTNDINLVNFKDIQRFSDYFIKEEVSEDRKHFRYVMKCTTIGCSEVIRIRHNEDMRECRHCAMRKRPYEAIYNSGIKRAVRIKANGQQIRWLLTYEEFVELCSSDKCHYCNSNLNRAIYRGMIKGSKSILLDRKDSTKDYTRDNCVPCCPDCNFLKNEHISYQEMILIMKYRGLWVHD